MTDASTTDRAAITLVDAILGFGVLVAVMALAPIIYTFIDMGSGAYDPFTALVLQLSVPLLILAVLISLGVSARRQ